MFLIDTNVLAEARRGDARAIGWLRGIDPALAYISVVTVGEIAKGIALQCRRDLQAAAALEAWLAAITNRFGSRILGIDETIMRAWGSYQAAQPRPVMDCLIAATARVHRKSVVTRNVADFAGMDIELINPWG
jgi:predicted nucleic acid-binding protein